MDLNLFSKRTERLLLLKTLTNNEKKSFRLQFDIGEVQDIDKRLGDGGKFGISRTMKLKAVVLGRLRFSTAPNSCSRGL